MKITFSKQNSARERGFNLVEIVVATGIISLSLVSVIATAGRSIALSHRAQNTYGASIMLEEGAEAVRIVRDDSWASVAALTAGVAYYPKFDSATDSWSLSTDPADGANGIYTRTVVAGDVSRSVTDDIDSGGTIDPGTRTFTVSVSWRESTGVLLTKSATFYLSDIFS